MAGEDALGSAETASAVVIQRKIAVEKENREDTALAITNHRRFPIEPECEDVDVVGDFVRVSSVAKAMPRNDLGSATMTWGALDFGPCQPAYFMERLGKRRLLLKFAIRKSILTAKEFEVKNRVVVVGRPLVRTGMGDDLVATVRRLGRAKSRFTMAHRRPVSGSSYASVPEKSSRSRVCLAKGARRASSRGVSTPKIGRKHSEPRPAALLLNGRIWNLRTTRGVGSHPIHIA